MTDTNTDSIILPSSIAKIGSIFCGCSDPQLAWQWVFDYLEAKENGHFHHPEEGSEMIAVYLMDHLQMTEHGVSVAGAWLTDEGKEALAFLKEHGTDWQEKGTWIDKDGVMWGYLG